MPEHVPSTTATTHELPDPSLPSATGRPTTRAYATVLILYALAGGPHLAGAALSLLHLYGVNLPVSSLQVESGGRLIGIALAATWLLRLKASGPRPADASRRWGRVIAFVGALTLIAADQVGEFASDHSSVRGVGRLAELILWVWLCQTLTARSGFTLPRPHLTGLLSPKRKQPSAQRQAQARWELVLYAYAAALLTAVLLVDALKELPGPVLTGDQAAAAGVPDLGSHLAHGIWSATIEELLATAVVVTLLTTVGRPLWEVLTVTALMRTLPHAYLGLLPMLAMLVPALAAGWLYHRYRRVLPLILAHALYNTASTLHLLPPPALMLLLALAAAAWAWHETRSTSPTEHGTFQRPQGVTRPHPTTTSHSSDMQESTGAAMFHSSFYLADIDTFLTHAAQHTPDRGTSGLINALETVTVEEAVYRYPGKANPAVAGVSLTLRRGEIIAVVGENGSGKSTLTRLLTAVFLTDKGTVVGVHTNVALARFS